MNKKKKIIDNYGKSVTIIISICLCFFIFNSIFIEKDALYQISDNKYIAWILNFFAGCEGMLGAMGSMSKNAVFFEGQWWRVFTHIYLHAGVFHLIFNMFALLFSGKVVEKKFGFFWCMLLFHIIAVIDAILMCLIFPDSTSVGASGGIFGLIGVTAALKIHNDSKYIEILKKREFIYLIVFTVLSLVLGFESFLTHFIAFILGATAGFIISKLSEAK